MVRRQYFNGNVFCPKVEHHKRELHAGKTHVVVDKVRVLANMKPGDKASCPCEMRACESQWRNTAQGQRAGSYVADGSYTKGLDGARPNQKVWHVPYQLETEAFNSLVKDFKGYHIITGDRDHDHPVAHTRAALGADRVLEHLPAGKYLDLFGNPGANRRSRHAHLDVHTTVELCTPKDFLRSAKKWGNWREDPKVREISMRDMSVLPAAGVPEWLAGFDGMLSFHTMYYMERKELGCLLAQTKGKILTATIHRHKGSSGTINEGEQSYVKFVNAGTSFVTQTNVLTGESYEHPDMEWVFEHDSWTDGTNGLAWTINKVCTDTFEVQLVWCPPAHCRMSRSLMDESEASAVAPASLHKATLGVDVSVCGVVTHVEVAAVKSYEEARALVSGKARTAVQFKDHLAATKRLMKKNHELSAEAAKVAVASFFSGMEEEHALIKPLMAAANISSRHAEKVLEGKDPVGPLNICDKVLGVAVMAMSFKSGGCNPKNVQNALRATRELLHSSGTALQV
jgi:phosphoribosylanthranilate isomerase